MKLRSKLFVAAVCLIIIMLTISYLLPSYLIKHDVAQISEKIYQSVLQTSREELNHQKKWFEKEAQLRQEQIKLLLLTIEQNKKLYENLLFSPDVTSAKRWAKAAELIISSPEVGMVQLYSPVYEEADVFFYDKAYLYNAVLSHSLEEENLVIVPKKKRIYKAYPYKENFYLLKRLLLPQEVQRSMLDKYSKWLQEEVTETQSAQVWGTKNHLIELLSPLYAEGIQLPGSNVKIIPDGIFVLSKDQRGMAILTNEAFQSTPIVDVEEAFDQSITLENQKAFLAHDVEQNFYLTYTILIDNTFITAGVSLSPLVENFAVASDKMLFLNSGKEWLGVDRNGKIIDTAIVYQFLESSDISAEEGRVTLQGHPYLFTRLNLFENQNLKLYTLYPLTEGRNILETLKTLVNSLSNRILLRIVLIGILMIALSIIAIFIITKSIVKPLESLVPATGKIAAGKYAEIQLPKVGKRKDEIAQLTHAFEQMVIDMQEREKIRSVLNKVLSKEIAAQFLQTKVHLGGEDRIVSMLFSDIRGFTALTENMPPQQVIESLNTYMTKMAEIIEAHQGIIDKFVGDEIMALFGAPVFHSDHAIQAITAGYLMLQGVKELNKKMALLKNPQFEIGIGVHTGPVVAGNMGAENRLNYTVLGKNVNLAARLCQSAKAGQLLITESVFKAPNIEEKFHARALEPITLKGFSDPIKVYEITGLK